ncbi:hypothetical protein AVEN_214261-1 [Araneus ventricosus]|uniref:Uncharacterized protein n=1 Tax=Araneus ventricosus TaxID=182803 RepID=A0A4Y2PVE0_ARAVE|nr:hypothetical protein AVEN_214261-1 [Araneus ventricosus]
MTRSKSHPIGQSLFSNTKESLRKAPHPEAYHMESCNITSRNQHVFLEGRSVDTAIHSLINRIADSKRLSKHVLVLSSDIKGAFDNLQHQAIINSLIRCGAPDNIFLIFISLLQNRLVTMQTPEGKVSKEQARG